MIKNKLTEEQQIEHMKENGIVFNIILEEEAKEFISENTYYFKIKAFSKNYNKDIRNKYMSLEFAYLKDLSTIDMIFRKLILSMVLNIEHSMKVKLNQDISQNADEDGYKIVNNFINSGNTKKRIENIKFKGKPTYTSDLHKKYFTKIKQSENLHNYECPSWAFVELLSFGQFIDFYNYYFNSYEKPNPIKKMLFPVKILRNAAAHNNCLLNNLKSVENFKINQNINSKLSHAKILSKNKKSRNRVLKTPVLHDFAAVVLVFNLVVNSKSMREHAKKDLEEFVERFKRNLAFYQNNDNIMKSVNFFKKTIDIL